MSEFKSALSETFIDFVRYRKACNRWNKASYEMNLLLFDKYCLEYFPAETTLCQKMVDGWCRQRKSESKNSCISRIYVIVALVRYLQERGLENVRIPDIPKAEKRLYIPHLFTEDELHRFFAACDSYRPYNFRAASHLAVKYTLPVFFRLLYSSGIRTTEARQLRCKDVNLETGAVCIVNTKGYEEHFVVLHESMLKLMKEYDTAIRTLYPEREYFFPQGEKGYMSRCKVAYYFRTFWAQVSEERATPYELRHNYAIENINKLINKGMSFEDSMIYLSKSMGNRSVDITIKYYYHLTPSLSKLLQQHTEDGFNELIPEVDHEEGE